ncbi:nucleotide exchange factor GrpE, partial [bacterium]|nr:nucleotide exchange factor GrpE [candidate division CSSED10-310 bacterium]
MSNDRNDLTDHDEVSGKQGKSVPPSGEDSFLSDDAESPSTCIDQEPEVLPQDGEAPTPTGADQELAVLKAEMAGYIDALQRLKAEFDNYRKRMTRERAEILRSLRESLVLLFLPIRDNLERAIAAAGEASDQAVVDGMKMIDQQFESVLNELGVKKIAVTGAPFDPNLHNAVLTQSQDGVEAGMV